MAGEVLAVAGTGVEQVSGSCPGVAVAVGAATNAPRAGSSVMRRFCESWNKACLTRVRDTPKWSASFCSASLEPGCSRCSTIARVSDSTIWCVVEDSMRS